MHPPLAIRAFLDNAGLDYQEVSEDVVLTMIPTDKLIVRVVISCLNHVLRILVGLPAIVPKYRQAEFQRAFEKLNAKLDWGTIFLDEETVYISVGLEFQRHVIPEQVQLCFEQAYDIASSHSKQILLQLLADYSKGPVM